MEGNYLNGTNPELPAEAITALEYGNKIEAIKHVRLAHHLGLKEAKELVEQYLLTRPDVKNRMAPANVSNSKNGIGLLLLIVLIGFAAYHFLMAA